MNVHYAPMKVRYLHLITLYIAKRCFLSPPTEEGKMAIKPKDQPTAQPLWLRDSQGDALSLVLGADIPRTRPVKATTPVLALTRLAPGSLLIDKVEASHRFVVRR